MAEYWHPQASLPGSQWDPQGNQPSPSPSAVRDLLRSFPRPRQTLSRVLKPRSTGNSPSSIDRRRSTAPYGSAYRPVSYQNYQTPYDALRFASAARGRKSRPISWHPASAGRMSYSTQYLPQSGVEYPSSVDLGSQPLNTIPSYMDGSMFSYPLDIQVSSDSFAPFSGIQDSAPMQNPPSMEMGGSQGAGGFDMDTSNMLPVSPLISDTWSFDMMPVNNQVLSTDFSVSNYESVPSSACLSAPSTPNFLPMQKPEPDSVPDDQEPEDELVGMGLYSTPMENSRYGLSGKGLKLEETFTPSSDNEEDRTPGDDDQESPDSNDTSSQQGGTFKQPAKAPVDLLRKSFFFSDEVEPYGVDDAQRLINWGDQSCINYGYGWI